jgi:hypothetical protein
VSKYDGARWASPPAPLLLERGVDVWQILAIPGISKFAFPLKKERGQGGEVLL